MANARRDWHGFSLPGWVVSVPALVALAAGVACSSGAENGRGPSARERALEPALPSEQTPLGSNPPGAPPGQPGTSGTPEVMAPANLPLTPPGTGAPSGEVPNPPSPGTGENGGASCPPPALPPFAELPAVAPLPDPFLSASGSRIARRDQWACRRAEISAQLQEYELGPKPPRPSIVEGSFANNQLTVTLGEPGNTIQLSAAVTRPAGAPDGPIPAVIAIDNNSLDTSVFAERGIATVTFRTSQLAPQFPSYGNGPFWQLHGAAFPAGAMIGWAWGVSRIIDALEQTPEANLDLSRLAVTGCSYAGKVALFSGAFDERIALTIAQESGGGGSASWRISQVQTAAILAANPAATQGEQVESLANAQGVAWYRQSLRQFNAAPERMPYDHHLLMGLVAPRALFVVDNSSMIYLGDESSYTDSVAAREIWQGLGVPDRMGASQVGGHNHCAFPASQRAELVAFVEKFLLDNANADTNVLRSDKIQPDRARWIPWATPVLQ